MPSVMAIIANLDLAGFSPQLDPIIKLLMGMGGGMLLRVILLYRSNGRRALTVLFVLRSRDL